MNIDEFKDINYRSSARRFERFLDPETKQPSALSREIVEFTITCKSREQFELLYRYFGGRKLVAIWDWKYSAGYYYLRNRKPIQTGVEFEIVMSVDYIGLELSGRSEVNPREFKHRVLVEEDFSGWSGTPISSWPLQSVGVGSQFESMDWYRRGNNSWYVSSKIRPDGSSGLVLSNTSATLGRAVTVRGLEAYSNLKIRGIFANGGITSQTGGLIFRFKDDAQTDTVMQESMVLSWVETEVRLYKVEATSWTLIWSRDVGETRPTVEGGTTPTIDDWYELGVNLIGPIIEVYWKGEFIDYIKYDRFQVGGAGVAANAAGVRMFIADIVVEKIHVPVYTLPAHAYQVNEFVHSAVHTEDGWVQRVINPYHPLSFWLKPENNLKGIVRIWDLRDGSLEEPHKWEEVTHQMYQFKGDMFVENGICGLLYSDNRLYYVYNEHLNNVLVGFDTSAWWSQTYGLKNMSRFKAYASPSAMKGSINRDIRWHSPSWMLHSRDEWNPNIKYNFDLNKPEIEAQFLLYAFKEETYSSGTRIASFNTSEKNMGLNLSAPAGKVKGEFKWFRESSSLEGRTNLQRAKVYSSKFSHGVDSQQLLVNGRADNIEFSPYQTQGDMNESLFERVRRSVVHVNQPTTEDARRAEINVYREGFTSPSLIPLKDDSNWSMGAIESYIVRRRNRGQQRTLAYDAIVHYAFDKGNVSFSAPETRFKDISDNANPAFRPPTTSSIVSFTTGLINEAVEINYGSTGQTWSAAGSITGHSSGHVAMSIFMKFEGEITSESADDIMYISTSGTDIMNFRWMGSGKFRMQYNGVTISDQIPIDIFNDERWHSIVICGGVDDNVMHLFIDKFHWSADCGAPTLAIDGFYIQNFFSASTTFYVDELVVLDGGVPASIGPYIGAFAALERKTEHELKMEFSAYDKTRWVNWDSNKLLIHMIFNEGVEDIGPQNHTVSTTAKYGCLKDGGFSVGGSHLFYSFDPTPTTGSVEDKVYLDEGFTIMWRGAIINNSALIDFRSASAAESIKIEGTAEGGLILTVQTDSGENKYLAQVDNDYHEFSILYHKGRAQLRVDDAGVVWRVETGNYEDDAKFLQGTQYFGGQIMADLVFAKFWVTKGYGLLSHDEHHWKTYYSLRYEDGATDFEKPAILSASRQAVEIIFQEVVVRLEAGNPLIMVRDTRNQEKTLRLYDERSEWTNIVTDMDHRDARFQETTAMAKEDLQKYIYILHQKSGTGFTVLNSPDAEADVSISESDLKYDYLTFPSTDTLILGFFNWPLWHYLKEGGQADGISGGATLIQGDYSFWTCAYLAAAGHTAYWNFKSPEYGSYLVLVRNHYGRATVRVGDSGDEDKHWSETFTGKTEWAQPVVYAQSSLVAEPAELRVTTIYNSGIEEIDYVALLPLGNGLAFPTDLIQQILTRNS